MKRIAILACRRSEDVCTGAGCLRAFFQRKGAFADYGKEDLRLIAFMHCNGCRMPGAGKDYDACVYTPLLQDPGLLEKVERLEKEQVEVVHVGVCCQNRQGQLCPAIAELTEALRQRGMTVVRGTHG